MKISWNYHFQEKGLLKGIYIWSKNSKQLNKKEGVKTINYTLKWKLPQED